jgi:hypothetical protein
VLGLAAGIGSFIATVASGFGIAWLISRASKDSVLPYIVVCLAFILASFIAPFAMMYGVRLPRVLMERKAKRAGSRGFPVIQPKGDDDEVD